MLYINHHELVSEWFTSETLIWRYSDWPRNPKMPYSVVKMSLYVPAKLNYCKISSKVVYQSLIDIYLRECWVSNINFPYFSDTCFVLEKCKHLNHSMTRKWNICKPKKKLMKNKKTIEGLFHNFLKNMKLKIEILMLRRKLRVYMIHWSVLHTFNIILILIPLLFSEKMLSGWFYR